MMHTQILCSSREDRLVRLLARGRVVCRKRFVAVKKDAT